MRPSEYYSCTWDLFDRECRGCIWGGDWIDDLDLDTPMCAMRAVLDEDCLMDDGRCPCKDEEEWT